MQLLILQFHYSYRSFGADFKVGTEDLFACILEAAFLHHSARGGIVGEIAAPERREAFFFEAVVNNKVQCFCAYTFAPIGTANPIAHFGVVGFDCKI